jgi:hypothetical protein
LNAAFLACVDTSRFVDAGAVGEKSGLPDGIFQTKNPNLGKFWMVWQ